MPAAPGRGATGSSLPLGSAWFRERRLIPLKSKAPNLTAIAQQLIQSKIRSKSKSFVGTDDDTVGMWLFLPYRIDAGA